MANPTRTRTRLARDERREQLVDAAAAVLQGRDPAEVTFEEIADAAGVSRALVYNYFGDRNGVLEAVYRRNLRLLRERIGAVVATARGRKALYELVRVNVEFAVENPAGYRYAAGESIFNRIPELEERRVRSVAQNFGGEPDSHVVARGWLSAIHGMVIYWLDHPDGVSAGAGGRRDHGVPRRSAGVGLEAGRDPPPPGAAGDVTLGRRSDAAPRRRRLASLGQSVLARHGAARRRHP